MGGERYVAPAVSESHIRAASHSAEPALVGIGYQFQVALLRLLRAGDDGTIFLETLDDIEFRDLNTTEIIQTKHNLRRRASLSDRGAEIWGTLQGWIDQLKADLVPPTDTNFIMVATGTAAQGSLAELLATDSRFPDVLRNKLKEIASDTENQAIKNCFSSFESLGEDLQEQLLECCHLVCDSPDAEATETQIRYELRRVHRSETHRDTLLDMILGWWFTRCFRHIREPRENRAPITARELQDEIDSFRDQLRPENLPLDLPVIQSADGEVRTADLYIRQLHLVGLTDQLELKRRVRDYMRASTARSEWYRRGLLRSDELEVFDERLRQNWGLEFSSTTAALGDADEDAKRKAGLDVLKYAEGIDRETIRRDCTESFVRRGSYHILADDPDLALGWHPEFKRHLGAP